MGFRKKHLISCWNQNSSYWVKFVKSLGYLPCMNLIFSLNSPLKFNPVKTSLRWKSMPRPKIQTPKEYYLNSTADFWHFPKCRVFYIVIIAQSMLVRHTVTRLINLYFESYFWLLRFTAVALCLQTVDKWALWKWGHFEGVKLIFKMLPAFWTKY